MDSKTNHIADAPPDQFPGLQSPVPWHPGRVRLLWLGTLVELCLGLVALGLGWLLGIPWWRHIDFSLTAFAVGVVVSLPMMSLFGICVRWPLGPLAKIKQFAQDVVRPMFIHSGAWELAIISATAGLGEELLFRGVLQTALSEWFGRWIGLAMASLLFGMMHPITVAYVILACLLGVYLGWIWMTSGNLLIVIVAHAIYDFLALLFVTRWGKW
jgi:membrane protease YdiL (CAAX protease family)